MKTNRLVLLASLFTLLLAASTASAEKAPYSSKKLVEIATHIVDGKVQAIYTQTEREGNYEYVRKVAEVKIEKLAKGKGPSGLIYVRYFDRIWKGKGVVPPGAGSYSPQPKKGESYRFYLSRNAYDGWSRNGSQDGGYNVVYVNGVQPVKK